MGKKKYFLFLLLAVAVFFSCTVNSTTGCIQVKNTTYSNLYSVKVGNTLIASYVAPGCYVNYWFYSPITGKLTSNGIEVNKSIQNTDFNLNPNYWFYITAEYTNDGNETVNISAFQQGETYTNVSDWQ